jgi:hypothetical protein
MKKSYFIAALAALTVASCADMKLGSFSLTTPYGTVASDKEGTISGGIVIPQKSGK